MISFGVDLTGSQFLKEFHSSWQLCVISVFIAKNLLIQSDLSQLYAPSCLTRSSSDSKLFVTPRLKFKMFGEGSLTFCGSKTWNSLSKD